jgi:alpha-mannosidase
MQFLLARKAAIRSVKVLRRYFLLLSFAGVSASVMAQPSRIYIANDDHTDLMWTADAQRYAEVFVEMLDFHLGLAAQTQGNAPPYRNRFNCDGSYWLWNYERRKSPEEFARLIEAIKAGTISAPLNTVVSCYGAQPTEAVLRGMYYAGRLERRHAIRFPLAVAMENQTLPLGLASLFAGSGAKYSWRGICGCATKMEHQPFSARPREIYWWTGPDGQRLLLKWHSLVPPGNQQIGGYSEAFDPVAAVKFLDSDPTFLNRYRASGASDPYQVRAAFGFGWDALNRKTGQPYEADPLTYPVVDHFHLVAQQLTDERRQVIVSNEVDFFEDFEKTHGDSLERQSVTYGNEWDLYSASMSETSAQVKRAVERLRSAELLGLLVSLKDPGFLVGHAAARDQAFNDLGLYWEHNWTADGPISRAQRAAWQRQLAGEVECYVRELENEAVIRLGKMIPHSGNAIRFFVLNPLGWRRTDVADVAYSGSPDVHVRDSVTNADVPHQLIDQHGKRFLRILASDVPSAGYKVFEIAPGPGSAARNAAAAIIGTDNSRIENALVKLTVERDGGIASLIDMAHGQIELVDRRQAVRLNDLAPDSSEGEPLRVENSGPVSVTLRARSQAGLDHTTAITLYRDSNRVDIHNEINENFSDVRYWSFGFALDQPSVRTEEVGAVILNKRQSAGGDYADSHARYDHVTVNHFADIASESSGRGVTISNPDLSFGVLGDSTADALDAGTPKIQLLAGGQVDGASLGIPSQDGNVHFTQRFALRPHDGYDAAAAMKFALEHQNPLVTGFVTGEEAVHPETSFSLVEISSPEVLLWALKAHDQGIENGIVARIWNMSDRPTAADVSFGLGVASAYRATHVETDIERVPLDPAGTLPARFARQQLQTYRIERN